MTPRYFFAAGPGNVIQAHKNWRDGIDDPGQMSITFSSEFEDFCREAGAAYYIVASAGPPQVLRDGSAIIELRPKRSDSGPRYHLAQISYGLSLLLTAVRFKADHAFLQSGSTHYFMMALFRLFGIRVVPILHNTLWPSGYPPTGGIARAILWFDALFFRFFATAALCVSPECERQIKAATRGHHCPMHVFTIQFNPERFEPTPPPPQPPFRLLFAGRAAENKGIFDLIEIIRQVEERLPGRVVLDICGDGPDLPALRGKSCAAELDSVITVHGWTEPARLRQILNESHASIVPTKSGFAEGMAMTVIEPVLLGRPVITNPVVPALEVLRGACMEAKTDDPASYAEQVVKLAQSQHIYDQLRAACDDLRSQFFDRSISSSAALRRSIKDG